MVYIEIMATKADRRGRVKHRMTRTRRPLKGVNIGRPYHDILELLVVKHGDSANGSIRAQAEAAIVCYAQAQGIPQDILHGTPEPPQDAATAP